MGKRYVDCRPCQALVPALGQTAPATNAAKLIAIGGTVLLSYLGMRLWVFAHGSDTPRISTASTRIGQGEATHNQRLALSKILAHHGISVVLPAYNEEQAITATVVSVVNTLNAWDADFEVIVVNDGSTDETGAVLAMLASRDQRVRSITHPLNRGYGAALATGFAAATKDLTFFMDADGQFAIDDLALLLGHIEAVDANLISYLETHQGAATYLVATAPSSTADPIILATGKAVMALGGFGGSDPTLTTAQLQVLIAKGAVRYFLLNGSGTTTTTNTTASGATSADNGQSTTAASTPGAGGGAQSVASQWVQQHCATVAVSAYGATTQTSQGGFGRAQQLYDCKAATA